MIVVTGCEKVYKVKTHRCSDLGVDFQLPIQLKVGDRKTLAKLEKRGDKAEDEAFPDAETRVWGAACLKGLLDDNGAVLDMATLPDKDVYKHHKTYSEFVNYYFRQKKYLADIQMQPIMHLVRNPEASMATVNVGNLTAYKLKLVFNVPQKFKKILMLTYLIPKDSVTHRIEYFGKDKNFTEFIEKSIESATPLK